MAERSDRHRLLVLAVIVLGLLLRGLLFVARPSLSMDEARLALNIAARDYAGLMRPLDLDQSAPLLYLWLCRLTTRLAGVNELALRLPALVSGALLLLATPAVLRRFVSPPAMLLGLALLAFAPTMVVYSNEGKQYMVETLAAMLLLRLALDWRAGPDRAASLRLAAAGTLAVWIAGSSVLVLAGMAPALLLSRTGEGHRRIAAAICVWWAVSFAAAYALVYRAAAANPYIGRFWAPAFLAPDAELAGRGWLAVKDFVWGFIAGHAGVARRPEADGLVTVVGVIACGCVAAGWVRLARTRGFPTVMLVAGPLIAVAAASALGLYPVGQRLLLFAVPLLVVLGVAGIEAATARLTPAWSSRVWLVVGGLTVSPLLAISVLQASTMKQGSRMRQVVRELAAHRRAGEPVYLFSRGLPSWTFYTTAWDAPDTARVGWYNRVGGSGGASFENAPSRGRPVAAGEGADLVYRTPAGDEIVGLPTGMEYVWGRGLSRREPDPGWYAREASRIEAAAAPGAWVVLVEFLGPEFQLVEELERRGNRITFSRFEPGHVLARFQSPPGPQPQGPE